MKKKDIITVIVAGIVLIAAVYLIFQMLFPSQKPKNADETKNQQVNVIPSEIDDKTFQTIKNLSDYGAPTLENIGKTDLFAGF